MTNPYAGTANTQSMLPMTPGNIPIIASDSSITQVSPQAFKNSIATMTADISDFASAVVGFGYVTSAAVMSSISAALSSYSTTSAMNTAITSALAGYDTITARNTAIASFITASALAPYVLASSLANVATSGSYLDLINLPASSVVNGVTRPIVTAASGTAGQGFLVSATQKTFALYSIQINVTASLLTGLVQGNILIEVCPTNSLTASDWVMVGNVGNGQNLTGTVALTSVQPITLQVKATIPKTYYARIRSVLTSGTGATFTYITGQETLIG